MTDRKSIARRAVAASLRLRRDAGYGLTEPVCVYDLAERIGIEVRFIDIPSMEGMYLHSELTPIILVSSLRPPGRRAFTCAHELGHHSNGDGTRIDELVEKRVRSSFDETEFAADCFAGILLMPKVAVERAFVLRNWKPSTCTPGQVYILSNYFGVGYSTLIHHLRSGLNLLSSSHANALLKVKPKAAQEQAVGWPCRSTIRVVDQYWKGCALDVEAGELVLVRGHPKFYGHCLEFLKDTADGQLFLARQPGIGRMENDPQQPIYARVSRRQFVGRNTFRHLEEESGEISNDHRGRQLDTSLGKGLSRSLSV